MGSQLRGSETYGSIVCRWRLDVAERGVSDGDGIAMEGTVELLNVDGISVGAEIRLTSGTFFLAIWGPFYVGGGERC